MRVQRSVAVPASLSSGAGGRMRSSVRATRLVAAPASLPSRSIIATSLVSAPGSPASTALPSTMTTMITLAICQMMSTD